MVKTSAWPPIILFAVCCRPRKNVIRYGPVGIESHDADDCLVGGVESLFQAAGDRYFEFAAAGGRMRLFRIRLYQNRLLFVRQREGSFFPCKVDLFRLSGDGCTVIDDTKISCYDFDIDVSV